MSGEILLPAGGWTPTFVSDEMSRAEGDLRAIAGLVKMDCDRLREYVELRDAHDARVDRPQPRVRQRTTTTVALEFSALAAHHCDFEIERLSRKAAALRQPDGPTAEQMAEDGWHQRETDRRLARLHELSEEYQRLDDAGEKLIQGSLFGEAA